MAKTKTSEIIVGLDIGTTKIACIVGEVTEDGVDIIGIGTAPSKGMRRGNVVNIDATVSSIRAGGRRGREHGGLRDLDACTPRSPAPNVRGINSNGIVAVKDKEVRDADIARVIEQAKAVAIPMDREVLHVLPQQYVVDDQDGIRDPLGMAGVRLEAKVHIVTTRWSPSAQNVIKCANRCNLQVADIVLESLAASQACLEDDEKELGVALIDIGGGTCDIMIYADGAIVHTSVLPLGGEPRHQRHRDRAPHAARRGREAQAQVRLRVARAGRAGRDDGGALGRRARAAHGAAPQAGRGDRAAGRGDLRARQEGADALGLLRRARGGRGADRRRDRDGGHRARSPSSVLGMPTRRGAPTKIGGLVDVVRSPSYSTGVGLVMFGAEQGKSVQLPGRSDDRPGVFKRAWSRLAEMF